VNDHTDVLYYQPLHSLTLKHVYTGTINKDIKVVQKLQYFSTNYNAKQRTQRQFQQQLSLIEKDVNIKTTISNIHTL